MNTQEVAEITGLVGRTVTKYAEKLGVAYVGEGRRKTYVWTESDVERLKEAAAAAKAGRPPLRPKP